ncbi:MAG TPA: N-acyl homoserine lactonase family protein [Acidimicrobiales bacterium]|nr:N-acyl homoserine lactonase family protein [Acidimicrobiales bacterium]
MGWVELPISVSIYAGTSGRRLREPVPGVLLETRDGWVLLDTGFNTALIRDPALNRRFHGRNHDVQAVLPGPGEPLEEALGGVGVQMSDIAVIALSHLHYDHAGGIKHFTDFGVPVHLQRRELEYGLSEHPGPEQQGMFRVDYDDTAIKWQLADGQVEVARGVTAVPTPGHTPGHQSFVVDIADVAGGGGFVFAFDAADLTENIEQELAIGGFINCTPEGTVESIRRLKAIAAQRGYTVVPGHDPVAWPKLTEELGRRWAST